MNEGRPRLLFVVTEDWTFWELRRDVARVAQDAGFEVLVATRVNTCAERIRSAGFRLLPISLLRRSRNPLREFAAFVELLKLYWRERPQIVQHVAMKPILYGSLAAWFARVPAVINVFGGLGYAFTDGPQERSILRRLLQVALRIAVRVSRSTVVFQNPDDQNVLVHERVVSLHHARVIGGSGVDTDRFCPADAPSGAPVVLLPGRMLWDKGVGEFVKAARMLRKTGVSARFALVGRRDEGNPSAIDEGQLARWSTEDGVEWWGHREDMPSVYAAATLVVLPSYREGLPKALLEAAACGKALIATDVPGCREIVRHRRTGLLVPDRDVAALADAIGTLLSDRDLRDALGRAAREVAVREYSHKKIGEEFLRLYRELLGESVRWQASRSLV